MEDVIAVILGGGRGTRLFPLTLKRSKPAVPIAGKYRLIDVPISNCLNSEVRRIFVLTQFNSESLNKHLSQTYKFDIFSAGFVSILAAEQTERDADWFQGTADAVRKSLWHLSSHRSNEVLILSGDQLYQMDYKQMLATHRQSNAEATVGVIPVSADQASQFGILKMDATGRIVHFEEKPKPDRLPALISDLPGGGQGYLASMGIYAFRREALEKSLADASLVDFGRHVIPQAVLKSRVQAYVFRGYWEDVGTIASYFHANLALTGAVPPFDFYDAANPIYTNPRFLPASKIGACNLKSALISEGCIIVEGAGIEHAVIGIRSRIGANTVIRDTLVLGADFYDTLAEIEHAKALGIPPIGIGPDCIIRNAIIDKNARIGRGVRIQNDSKIENHDGDRYFIREGIVIVPKGAVIPDGMVI